MNEKGFSLMEFMIAIAIFSVIIGYVYDVYLTMLKSNILETSKIEQQFEASIDLQILANDIKNAGFCTPTVCAIASKDNLSSAEAIAWEGFTNTKVAGIYSNIVGTDRLYLSDMGELVDDFSDDEILSDADYTTLANTKLNNNGYFATLSGDFTSGDSIITVNITDIDGTDDGSSSDHDFKARKALIIADISGSPLEGRRIAGNHEKSSTSISFIGNESLDNDFINGSYIVPAICYHLKEPGSASPFYGQPQVFTLARNSDPFLEGIEDFQVAYHYDSSDDGTWEWLDSLPSSEYDPNLLRSIRVTLIARIPKKQSNEVESRSNITLENHNLNLTSEMKYYYRKQYTIDIVPRNMREG